MVHRVIAPELARIPEETQIPRNTRTMLMNTVVHQTMPLAVRDFDRAALQAGCKILGPKPTTQNLERLDI